MQIFLGADHRGFELKNALRDWLTAEGYEVVDAGPNEYVKTDDYPDYAFRVGKAMQEAGEGAFGILACGGGAGMAVAANKVKGVRAAMIHDPELAKMARIHDNLNVVVFAADFIDLEQAKAVVTTWLDTSYQGEERHQRRIDKITQYEERN